MVKTHYSTYNKENVNDKCDGWSPTFCGLDDNETVITDRIENVTCKKCLKIYEKQKIVKNEKQR